MNRESDDKRIMRAINIEKRERWEKNDESDE